MDDKNKSVVVDLTKAASATAPAPEAQAGVDISKLTPEQMAELAQFVEQIKSKIHKSKHSRQRLQSKNSLAKKKTHKKRLRKIALASKRMNRKLAA